MKLLFVIPEYPPHSGGGISTFYRNLLPELVKQGHQVHVLVSNALSNAFPNYEMDGVAVEFIDRQRVSANLGEFDCYHALPELQRHLANAWTTWNFVKGGQNYDVVETTDWGLLFAPWIASPDSPPTVVQLHASIGQIDFYDPQLDNLLLGCLIRLFEAGLLANADELQANSQSNARSWNELLQRNVTYIPPALEISTHLSSGSKSSRGLVVGRIQYWKGPTVLCEALRLLGAKAPNLDWLGRDTHFQKVDASMTAYLQQTYPDVWSTKISPLGTLPSEETLALQAKAAFMIVPSIWDVFNYTCAEGMAQAQTVICSEGAGASDLITNGVNGFTFTAGDANALAERLETLLSLSPAQRTQIGEAARHTISTQLAPARIAQQRIEAYEKLLQRGRSSVRPNSWLLDAVSPGQPLEKPLAFLDHLPLRELSHYVLQRSIQKLRK